MKMGAISYVEQEQLLSGAWARLKRCTGVADRLQEEGCLSFRAWGEFELRCCENDQEREELPRYQEERARGFFVRPDEFLGPKLSQYLSGLMPWRSRYSEGHPENNGRLKLNEQLMWERFVAYRHDEEEKYNRLRDSVASNLSDDFPFCFSRVLQLTFLPMGFLLDPERSYKEFPVLTKSLNDSWDLCWSAETVRYSRGSSRVMVGSAGVWTSIKLVLYLVNRGFVGEPVNKIGFNKSRFMVIRLGQLVSGFDWAYSKMKDVTHMAICLSAYANLYAIYGSLLEEYMLEELSS